VRKKAYVISRHPPARRGTQAFRFSDAAGLIPFWTGESVRNADASCAEPVSKIPGANRGMNQEISHVKYESIDASKVWRNLGSWHK